MSKTSERKKAEQAEEPKAKAPEKAEQPDLSQVGLGGTGDKHRHDASKMGLGHKE